MLQVIHDHILTQRHDKELSGLRDFLTRVKQIGRKGVGHGSRNSLREGPWYEGYLDSDAAFDDRLTQEESPRRLDRLS